MEVGRMSVYFHLAVITLILQIFLQPAVSSELYRCPSHLAGKSYLKTFRNHCFLFVNTEREWTDARDDCYNNGGGHHVVIPDSATQDFVINSLDDLNWSRNGIWIGAYYEGTWKWVNGEPWSWTNWDVDEEQPDRQGWLFSSEECGQIRLVDGLWHDYLCSSSLFEYTYICQYDMSPPTTTTTSTTSTTTSTTTTSTTTKTTGVTTTTTNAKSTSSSTTKATTSSTHTATSSTQTQTTPAPSQQTATSSTQTQTTTAPSQQTATSSTQTQTTPIVSQQTSQQSSPSVTNLTIISEFLKSEELGAGAIAGIVSAVVLLGMITGVLFLIVVCRRKRKEKEEPSVMFDNRTYTLEQEQNRGNENRNSNPYDEITQHRPTVAVNPKFTANGGTKNLDYYLTPKTHVDLPDRKSGACSDSKLDDSDDESTIDVDKTKENQYDDINFTDPKIANSILQFDENDLSKTPVSYNNNLYDTME